MYYRRWTRMFLSPALKYLHKYRVIQDGFLLHQSLFNNIVNPQPMHYKPKRVPIKQNQLDNKLINKLFQKYPDLKYESIDMNSSTSSFSYAYSFLSYQKKLMKEGYSIGKAFQITEKVFQDRINRKLDQTLLSRGLAIGNRARSFLTIYQQQVEYESKLKTIRTRRQLAKYQRQLSHIQQQSEQITKYTRITTRINNQPQLQNQDIQKKASNKKRFQDVVQLNSNFINTFQQFYERAAYKDKLQGLTDEEIKNEILESPKKIKSKSKQLVQYLKQKIGASLDINGEIVFNNNKYINPKLKEYIKKSNKVKIALLMHELDYQKPQFRVQHRFEKNQKRKLLLEKVKSRDKNSQIMQNKLKEYEAVLGISLPPLQLPSLLLQSEEERLMRLQLAYYKKITKREQDTNLKFDELLDKFRRLKFRVEKHHRNTANQEILFQQHYALKNMINVEDQVQFEELHNYFMKKTQERRLTNANGIDDNKIYQTIKVNTISQIPQGQGTEKLT